MPVNINLRTLGRNMFGLTEDQILLQAMVRRLARESIAPLADTIDKTRVFPWEIVKILANADLLKMNIPQEYGGLSSDKVSICLAIEEIAKINATSAHFVSHQTTTAVPLTIAGTEEQKKKYFGILVDEGCLSCISITEPGAGSDAASIKTKAVKFGDDYLLNGTKCFATNGGTSRFYIIFAVTDPERGHRGISCFLVDKGTPGLAIGKEEEKLGMRASNTTEIILEDVLVPKQNLLGKEGDGFKIAMAALTEGRLAVGALSLGIAQGALDYALRYAKERVQFGQAISEFQGIQFTLADMATEIEAARTLTYHTARMVEANSPEIGKYCAMTKRFASDTAIKVTNEAVLILGGYGYTSDHPVERMLRDAKMWQIVEGTNHIQRLIIARHLLKD